MDTAERRRVEEFWRGRARVADGRVATHFRHDAALLHDRALVERLVPVGAAVLDLGAGTGALASALAPRSARVVAVDYVPEFVARLAETPGVEAVCSDVMAFAPGGRFDAVLIFGVMNYLSPEESATLYARCRGWLEPGGVLVVKHQCGVDAVVRVDGHSDEIGSHYTAVYRPVLDERRLLEDAGFRVRVHDPYPPELNRWSTTRFHAFEARPA
jgi:cyclopropane fatty-acyl-phospholipid synthase-like methyltransferase